MSERSDSMTAPLDGIRVIEAGQYISGPYAGRQLADLGADVIKVESPGGDPMRRWQGGGSYSPQFGAYNRGKRGVVLDLKDPGGRDALLGLLADADVFIENFRPGVADRLGVGWRAAQPLNPGLVYCSITGFGPSGPYARRPAYDTVISAIGGMYGHLVPLDAPRPVGPAFADLLSGMSAAQAILAALHARDRSGEGAGQRVEISMLGALTDFLTEPIATYLETGAVVRPGTRAARAQAYGCVGSDERPFVIHLSVPEKFWTGLLEVIERPDLAGDERFATREARYRNYDALDAVLKAETRRLPRCEWFERLTAADIPHGPLNTVADLVQDPQVIHMGLVEDHEVTPGTRFSAWDRPRARRAPGLGEHTTEVLDGEQ